MMFSEFQDQKNGNEVPLMTRRLPSDARTLQDFPKTQDLFTKNEETTGKIARHNFYGQARAEVVYSIASADLSTSALKEKAKSLGITVNSLMLGAICVAYHRIIP